MIPVDLLNYRLLRQIGSGGMGQVFLAQNKNINQLVAVKALHPNYANNPMLRSRFKQEALMLSSLNHPNIVKFLNYVENEYGVFLIMEYVEGYTLEDFINKKNGLIVEKRAYPMMNEILDAFSYAHKKGIIHRDIKPSNIFITNDGHIKVMDFGIAQILTEVGHDSNNRVMGTPVYMSPEQVYGSGIDQRSDVYSLGVLLHQMLTGRAPYDSTTLSEYEIKNKVVNDNLPRMKEYYPYVSEGLQKVVDKATSKDADSRYKNCDEMKRAIKAVVDPEPINRTHIYIAAAIAILIAGVSFGVWDYFRTKVYYYKDYAEFNGVPEGIYKLSSREMHHRRCSYKMEFCRYKLRRMTLVNSKGNAIDHHDTEHKMLRYPDVEYFYTDNGKIDYKKVYDEHGKLLFKLDYDENLKTATFKYDDEYGTAMRLMSNTTDLYIDRTDGSLDRSNISRYLLDYDEETGLLRSFLYAGGDNNNKVGDQDNIYGQSFRYDDKGRIVNVKFLAQDGNVRGNKIGLAIKEFTYNDDDDWVTVSYFSADGSPSHDGNNCALVTLKYDKWGNRISELYSSIDGVPSMRTDFGAFGFNYVYNDEGFLTDEICVDGKEKPIINRSGWATEKFEYDDYGYVNAIKYYDLNGNPTNNSSDGEAYSAMTLKNDERGLCLEASYFNTTGDLIELTSGVSRFVFEYDSIGNKIKSSYYDKKGNLTRMGGFNSYCTYEYDDFYRVTKIRYFDDKNNFTDGGSGITGNDIEYDSHGNIYRYVCIGADGKTPGRCNNNFAFIVYSYDEMGNNTIREFFDEKGEKCTNASGIHKVECVYEPKTNFLVEEKFYGLGSLSYSDRYEYDDNGNTTKAYSITSSGSLKANTVVTNCKYDKNNRISEEWYTNLSGNQTNYPGKKFAKVQNKFDDRGNIIEQTFLTANGKPGSDEMGTYRRVKKYDAANRLIYEKNLDANGNPISGKNASPEAKVTYDERGNVLTLSCYDGYGKPCLSADGYHKRTVSYNERNDKLEVKYTDTEGKLIESKSDNCARITYEYDSKGNCILEKYYKKNDKLDVQFKYTYNSRGNHTSMLICNSAGKQDDSKYSYSKLVIEYQSNGVIASQKKYYNASGKLLATQKFNSQTNKWGELVLTGGSAPIKSTTNWKTQWINEQNACPQKLADGVYITSINVYSDEVDVYFKFTNISAGDLDDDDNSTLRDMMVQAKRSLRSATNTPSSVSIYICVYDKNGKYIFMV